MSADERPVLTYAMRELVWGIGSEVAVVGMLSRRIDDRVRDLNALRAELAQRLERLDQLQDSASDPFLSAYMAGSTPVQLPEVVEDDAPLLRPGGPTS